MFKKYTILALLIFASCLPIFSQADFEYSLSRARANKIVLIGARPSADIGKWRQVINSDDIYIHSFVLLDRASLTNDPVFGIRGNEVDAFERWLRQQYGLESRATWVALDIENKLIVSGIQVPNAKEFDQMLEQRGVKSPLKTVREFLQRNPDHLDAKGDLLTEVRRRALQRHPSNATEDLGTENDLVTWGILAAETDKVFSAPWQGISIRFFRPDQEQPERFSNLMKNVFRKHIAKIESAIAEQPSNAALWNIWAWMARGLGDYKWDTFVNSIEPFHFPPYSNSMCPPPDVCVWLIEEYRQKKDWGGVLKFAKNARGFDSIANANKAEWVPGGITFFGASEPIKDYPAKSSWAPQLEALLRLGRIDDANNLYDEMIRVIGRRSGNLQYQTNNAQIAANVAMSLGMEETAKIWEQGQQIAKAPYLQRAAMNGFPAFYIIARVGSDFFNSMDDLAKRLLPRLTVVSGGSGGGVLLPWDREDTRERWALVSGDNRILAHDAALPNLDDLQNILYRNNIKGSLDYARTYISEHGSKPGIELFLAFELIRDNTNILRSDPDASSSSGPLLESQWNEAVARLRGVASNSPEALFDMPHAFSGDVAIKNESMNLLSKPMLEKIELLLQKSPSMEKLWSQWFLWRHVEGADRPIDPLIEAIEASPLAMPSTVPPGSALDQYLSECRRNENWAKVIKLLKSAWDREYPRIVRFQKDQASRPPSTNQDANSTVAAWYDNYYYQRNKNSLGDRVGIPLIEAYLNDNKPFEAGEIFNAWLESGGKFVDISKIVALATEKGQGRLAREWEAKVKK
jgi:hypothetical protein